MLARASGVATLLVAAAFVRPSMRIPREMAPALVAIGVCDVTANSLFAVATNHGLLSLVAVAGSMYGGGDRAARARSCSASVWPPSARPASSARSPAWR